MNFDVEQQVFFLQMNNKYFREIYCSRILALSEYHIKKNACDEVQIQYSTPMLTTSLFNTPERR